MEGIGEITRKEAESLRTQLRLVILSDYIRAEELPSSAENIKPLAKIGVIPIFEYLRREDIPDIKLGVLTGSVIIIPKGATEPLSRIAMAHDMDQSHIRFSPLAHDNSFVKVQVTGESKQRIVHLITELFNAGEVNTLVGTQALLGEGWDAPAINGLVLASFVGSYMLSNQMRGRAIRVDAENPSKTANIWHLAAVDLMSPEERIRAVVSNVTPLGKSPHPFDHGDEGIGEDYTLLKRRFSAFVGISYMSPEIIESGHHRLGLTNIEWNRSAVGSLNHLMFEQAKQRDLLAEKWENALEGSSPLPQMHENVVSNYAPVGFALQDTINYLVVSGLVTFVIAFLSSFRGVRSLPGLEAILIVMAILFCVLALPKLLKAFLLTVRNGSLEKSTGRVGRCVLEALQFSGVIKTASHRLRIRTRQHKNGIVFCRLEGATTPERKHFLEAMSEVLGPTDNQRYLLVRHSAIGIIQRTDYHPVPKILGQSKTVAEFFAARWQRHVGPSTLFYTRSTEGRKQLVQARTKSFAAAFRKKTERRSIWE
ncbi:hypothetical protein [Roseibium sp.]|uniref:hypothetical protein n=1 Tax=Roseibium sp. TaxID=1936156 RepID=UPI003B5055DA